MPRGKPAPPDAPCTSCNEQKPFGEFYPNPAAKNGRESRCKECCRARVSEYAQRNPKSAEYSMLQGRKWRADNTEKNRAYQAKWRRDEYRRLRLAGIGHYGGVCVCCGEAEFAFLCIDHVNGGGNAHRRELGNRVDIYRWLKRAGYPAEGFQVLCHNCNFAKSVHGICPHQAKKETTADAIS